MHTPLISEAKLISQDVGQAKGAMYGPISNKQVFAFVNARGPSLQVGSGSVVSYAHLAVDQASGREGKREKRAIHIGSRSLAGYRSYLGAGASIGNGSMVREMMLRCCDAVRRRSTVRQYKVKYNTIQYNSIKILPLT